MPAATPSEQYRFWRGFGWPAMAALRSAYSNYRGRLHLGI